MTSKYIGKKLNMLTVMREVQPLYDKRGTKIAVFECLCECGNTTLVRIDEFSRMAKGTGRLSCGCLRKEMYEKGSMGFKHGGSRSKLYGLWNNINDNSCKEWQDFKVFENWYNENKNNTHLTRIDKTLPYSPDNCIFVDISTIRLNANMSSRNKSGHKGVSWSKSNKKWRADYRGKDLGHFDDIEDAIRARKKAEIEYPKLY